ncbi:hypothetical protein VTO73DRAFT_8752 [Trametes versicolor]
MVDDFELCPASDSSSTTKQSPDGVVQAWKSPQWAVPSGQVSTSLRGTTADAGTAPVSYDGPVGHRLSASGRIATGRKP